LIQQTLKFIALKTLLFHRQTSNGLHAFRIWTENRIPYLFDCKPHPQVRLSFISLPYRKV